jgi:zona occludens toxin
MIILNTGTAGAGKTLFTLRMIETRRLADNKEFYDKWVSAGSDEANPPIQREVYYFNININRSALPWIKLDKLEDWYTMPAGSIFFFDECQEAFEPMANSATRPKYYTELSKHRHRGYDMYFVTQHPTFVDTYVRKNAEEHNHFMRPFGAKMVNKHTWKGVKDQCDKSRSGAITEQLTHPKEVYGWYKSSEVHTHKFKLPNKVKALILLPIALAVCVYFAYDYFKKKTEPAKPAAASSTADKAGQHVVSVGGIKAVFNPADYVPRIPDLPHTAPRYDHLTEATVAPRIVGCMVYRQKCKCLTQQGTYHIATMQFCTVTIENGIFQDFEDGGGSSKPTKEPIQAVKEPAKPEPSPVAQKPAHVDSGFNLPVKPPADKYALQYTTQQSGDVYYKKLPSGGVMYGGQ